MKEEITPSIEINKFIHKLNNLNMAIFNYVDLLGIRLKNKNELKDKNIEELLERINNICLEVMETSKRFNNIRE
jgi:hypothetical protein